MIEDPLKGADLLPIQTHGESTAVNGVSAAPQNDVSIVIISYNTRRLTLACVDSVYRETQDCQFEVIVVDNASADGSAEAIEKAFPQVTLIANKKNLGFGTANNLGARLASGRYILLLNPDTVILEDAIGAIVRFADKFPEAGIYGGRTLFEDGTLNPASAHRRPTLWGLLCQSTALSVVFKHSPIMNVDAYGGWKRDTVRSVDIVSGCFLLISRTLWESLEGFDERYFMYCEEDDLCMRAVTNGAAPMICPDASLVHYGGASETSRADKLIKRMTSQGFLLYRHWPHTLAYAALLLQRLYVLNRWIMWQIVELTRSASPKHHSSTFREVWRRRDEWSAPYIGRSVNYAGTGIDQKRREQDGH